jgi:predicted O-methyltransferase YrrM
LKELIEQKESGTFDFAYIDADKINNLSYYENSLTLLKQGGLIVIDNTIRRRDILDPNIQDDFTIAVRNFNDFVATDERVESVITMISDGVTFCRKL